MYTSVLPLEKHIPCRLYECFFEGQDYIEVSSSKGRFRIKNSGMQIWLLIDGQNTIEQIVDLLRKDGTFVDYANLFNSVVALLKALEENKLIVMHWDPLL